MYRNTYLQHYKSSVNKQSNINILLAHCNHIYSTLGCVIQDLQFQIGKIIVMNQSNASIEKDIINYQDKKYTNKIQKQHQKQKQTSFKTAAQGQYKFQKPQQKHHKQIIQIKQEISPSLDDDYLINKLTRKQNKQIIKQQHNQKYGLRHNINNQIQKRNDSFDSLFLPNKNNINNQKIHQKHDINSHNINPQMFNLTPSNQDVPDIFQKIFNNNDKRKTY